jgi:6-phosphogluconolactonase
MFLLAALSFANAADYFVYVGTYTRGKSKGIYAWRFRPAKGELAPVGLVAETTNPSWVTVHPNRRFLYAVGESAKAGTVSAFAIDAATGRLTKLNQASSKGAGPCHLAVDKTGKNVLVANYGSGSVAVLPVREDGGVGEASCFLQHKGSSVNPQRQQGPHAHSVNLDPRERFALVPDLGLDEVLIYRFDAAKGALAPNDPPFAKVAPGAGPRHFAFHPNGRFGYVISEMGSTVTAFAYDGARGSLREIQVVSTLPDNFTGQSSTAEVAVHPNGRFLYGSNRGHDSIAVFAVDPGTGTLTFLDRVSTEGKTPRNFAIDPTGRWLFAANQDSDNIVVFHLDSKTGKLTPAGKTLEVGAPVSLAFVEAK